MIHKYGIRAHDLGVLSPEQIIEQLNQLELDGVQLAPLKVFDHIKTHDDFIMAKNSSVIIKSFHKHAKEIMVLGCYLNHTHPEMAVRDNYHHITKQYIDIAAQHGIKSIGTETFTLNANGKPHVQDHTEYGYQQFLRQIEPLVAYAESKQIALAIEPAVHHIIFDIAAFERLKSDLQSRALKVIFDPVNLMTPELAKDQNKFFYNFFERFEQDITMVHVKDFKYHGDEKEVLTAGLGALDYRALFDYVKESNQLLDVALEGVEITRLNDAVGYMKQK